MKKLLYILSIALAFVACESMEDTYSEYNTPKDRYVGKCSDLKIELGWERFRLSWKNNVDAAVENIRVTWEDEVGKVDTVILPAGTEVYETPDTLKDQSYKFTLAAIDSRGRESFPIEGYGKPFTDASSKVQMLKVVEKKFYFVENELIMLFYEAGKDIYKADVTYLSNGVEKVQKITSEDFVKGRLVLTDVDADTDIRINGKMKMLECIDTIPLDEYVLDRNKKSWSGGFIGNMRQQLDLADFPLELLDTLTTLYVDDNISSLEDILYMPKLERVVLGKNRMNLNYRNIEGSYASTVDDTTASLFALRKMRELKGIEVDIYGDQFHLKDSLDFENWNQRNNPTSFIIPTDVNEWELSFNDPNYYENEDPYPYGLNLLLRPTFPRMTDWRTIPSQSEIKTHEIVYDMKELKEVKGFQFSQTFDNNLKQFCPKTVQIHVSEDGTIWDTAFFQATMNVGGVAGEVRIKYMNQPKSVRYIKLIVRDVEGSQMNQVTIGTFLPII